MALVFPCGKDPWLKLMDPSFSFRVSSTVVHAATKLCCRLSWRQRDDFGRLLVVACSQHLQCQFCPNCCFNCESVSSFFRLLVCLCVCVCVCVCSHGLHPILHVYRYEAVAAFLPQVATSTRRVIMVGLQPSSPDGHAARVQENQDRYGISVVVLSQNFPCCRVSFISVCALVCAWISVWWCFVPNTR
jgi:hypothetical protein